MSRSAALLLLAALLASAQSPAVRKKAGGTRQAPSKTEESGPVWRIESLKVEGNQNYTAEQILQVARLKVGQPGTKQAFDAARDRLIASGAFENAGYRYTPSAANTGYDATIQVQEAEPVYPYRFEELPAEPKELEAALKESDLLFGPKIPATEVLLNRYAAALQQYLSTRGFTEKVTAKVSLENVDDLMVVFRPATLPQTVAEVRFTGASAIPAIELQRAIHGVAIGSVYQESRFRQYLETTLRPLYENRGRLRVSFPKLSTDKATDVKGLIVTVAVNEGESYTLGDVTVVGAPSRVKFKTGDVANMAAVQEGVDQIHQQLRRQGYMNASSQVDRKFDDTKHSVNLTVRVIPGPQYTFGDLRIQGLDIIGEAAMKKMWGLETGKPFDAGYPDAFLNRIREEGLFDSLGETKSVVKVNEDAKTADVTLLFRGAPAPERRDRRRENR